MKDNLRKLSSQPGLQQFSLYFSPHSPGGRFYRTSDSTCCSLTMWVSWLIWDWTFSLLRGRRTAVQCVHCPVDHMTASTLCACQIGHVIRPSTGISQCAALNQSRPQIWLESELACVGRSAVFQSISITHTHTTVNLTPRGNNYSILGPW